MKLSVFAEMLRGDVERKGDVDIDDIAWVGPLLIEIQRIRFPDRCKPCDGRGYFWVEGDPLSHSCAACGGSGVDKSDPLKLGGTEPVEQPRW